MSGNDGFVSGGAGGAVKTIQIGALQPASKDFVLVALIIGKSEPRRVVMKKDGMERFVASFTLRDSPSDIINLTLWTSREEAENNEAAFKIGSIIELVKPRVMNRDFGSDQEKFSASASSPFQLGNIEGKTTITVHMGDWARFQPLLSIPTKASAGYFSLNDVIESKNLVGKYVDLCVAVRTVGPAKSFQAKSGEERRVRDVKLFDITSPCVVMKIWDMNIIEMSDSWIARETVLFLADIRVSYDDWRGCNTVTCTGKTIITENPNIEEAKVLSAHCRTADFSSYSRMDGVVASIHPGSITQVHNVFSLQDEFSRVYQEKEAVLLTNIYGTITRFDIDQDKVPIVRRCGNCSGLYKKDESSPELSCINIDCKDYRSMAENRSVVLQYDVKVDLSDETGTLLACILRPEVMERLFGVKAADFAELSEVSRRSFKLDFFLKPLKLTLGIMLPTHDRKVVLISVVDMSPATLEEICSKMPISIIK